MNGSERVRMYRDFYHALDSMRAEIQVTQRRSRNSRRRLVVAGLAGMILTGGVVAAISSSTTTFYGMSGEAVTIDTSVFTLTTAGLGLAAQSAVAAGTTNSFAGATELLASNAGAANTALTLGHWIYQVTLSEAGINSFAQSATAYYKLELFLDGASQGSVYVKNALGDVTAAEGAVVKWTLGANAPNNGAYVVKVTQMAS